MITCAQIGAFGSAGQSLCALVNMLDEPISTTTMLVSSDVAEKPYYVYPRLKTFLLRTKTKTAKDFAIAAGVSTNTISNIFSGGNNISDVTIARCEEGIAKVKTDLSGNFDFVVERMPAEVKFEVADLEKFIGNKSIGEISAILDIPEYMWSWISRGKPISRQLAEKLVNRAQAFLKKN
jgi:transcriptional regulator with XRE-family HTH domain